jgi:hypothetical protein
MYCDFTKPVTILMTRRGRLRAAEAETVVGVGGRVVDHEFIGGHPNGQAVGKESRKLLPSDHDGPLAPTPSVHPPDRPQYIWDEDGDAARNYSELGEILATCGDLHRRPGHAGGLILLPPEGRAVNITRGAELAPIVVDRLRVQVVKGGKPKGGKIDSYHLNSMLMAEVFLGRFLPVDRLTTTAEYLPDFSPTEPGYNDGGRGNRILYVGDYPPITDSLDRINAFLNVMAFESNADRTNAVAAALTVILRNHWPGGKPVLVVTASKSHAGKDTVIAFAAGMSGSVSISYQATNWAFERSFVGAVNHSSESGVVVVENARLERHDKHIASAFLERLVTDPEPLLFSTGTGRPVRRPNDLVVAISTNYGSVSEDIMNRSLPIHLNPVGNVADRVCPIGNPKLEFLPANRERIAAELRGMIERWKRAGRPLDEDARHPFTVWAKTVGGILLVNGFRGFLGNNGVRKTADDPARQGLGILGSRAPDEWLPAADWARLVSDLGLVKTVVPPSDQDSEAGRRRGLGVVLTAHRGETFQLETDEKRFSLRLEKRRGRFGGGEVQVRYRFVRLAEEDLPLDAES